MAGEARLRRRRQCKSARSIRVSTLILVTKGRFSNQATYEKTNGSALGSGSSTRKEGTKSENHGKTLADSSDEEQLAATDALDSEPGGCREDGVDDHVDTAEQQSEVVAGSDGGLEQDWEVVDDGVAASDLLHHLGAGSEDHAAEVLRDAALEERGEGRDSALVARSLDGVRDDSQLLGDVGVVATLTGQSCQHGSGVVCASLGEQPTGRLGELEHQDEHGQGEDTLEGDGESPDEGVGSVGASIVFGKRTKLAHRMIGS